MKNLINCIVFIFFIFSGFPQNKLNEKILLEYNIVNEELCKILDETIEEYKKCENTIKGYHFTITVQDVKNSDSFNIKSLYISQSYYKNFISDGYGFLYYKEYLFILQGEQLNDNFKKTGKEKKFLYKEEPILTFDPPRWLYYYYNFFYYLVDSSPCGG